MSGAKSRLDRHLVCLGLFDSRAQAAASIKAGQVRINGQAAHKAAQMVSADDAIEATPAHGFVSRGGLKLAKALAHFGYPVAGKNFVDIGASTGGFTDVLLQNGAAHVFAVDVGHGQLHPRLQTDPRVTNMQNTNMRHLTADDFDHPLDGLVCDVSFISLELVLADVLSFVQPDGWMVALIKPQFEVGKKNLGKKGVVSDPDLHASVCARVESRLAAHAANWQIDGIVQSPITGSQGNVEFLIGGRNRNKAKAAQPSS